MLRIIVKILLTDQLNMKSVKLAELIQQGTYMYPLELSLKINKSI